MASIRKRILPSGECRWLVDYRDQSGKRRAKQFERKRDAESWAATALHEVKRGTHTPESASITVAQAAKLWLERCERDGLEYSTLRQYRQHERCHVVPLIGTLKLSRLTAPEVHAFLDRLLESRSRPLARKVLQSLSAIVSEAQRRGHVSHNIVRDVRVKVAGRHQARHVKPTREELRQLIEGVSGRWRPLIVTAIFTGLRSSELRGLSWLDVDLKSDVLHVRRRVDDWGQFGPPKSEAGTRDIPLAPLVANVLREWKLRCPRSDADLVFPNTVGNVESHSNIMSRGFRPLQIKCGIVDGDGKPKYGLHALRHAAAALMIEQGFNAKTLQSIMGHASIQMTYDQYGYLLEDTGGNTEAMAQIEARLLG